MAQLDWSPANAAGPAIEDTPMLCENMRFRYYKAGETIFEYGDYGDQFFIILKGTVSVLVPKQKEKNTIKRKPIARSKTFVKESSTKLAMAPLASDRFTPNASSSSTKTTAGACLRACSNPSQIPKQKAT